MKTSFDAIVRVGAVGVAGAVAVLGSPAVARADTCVDSGTGRHVNAAGEMFDRARELAATVPLDITFNATDQVVDVVGDTVVIHGVNTLMQGGKVKDRQRFSDVFVLQHGNWKALSAQETRI